jgi:hypothetical protein
MIVFHRFVYKHQLTFHFSQNLPLVFFSLNYTFIVRFEVFRAVTMKNAVFWDVALCTSCVNRRFGGTYRLNLQGRKIRELHTTATCSRWFLARGFFYPEDGGDTFLRNVGSHKKYTAPHPRNRHSSSLFASYLNDAETVFKSHIF